MMKLFKLIHIYIISLMGCKIKKEVSKQDCDNKTVIYREKDRKKIIDESNNSVKVIASYGDEIAIVGVSLEQKKYLKGGIMITKLNLQKRSWLLRKKDVLNSDM